jgi:thioester reductase-like protein
VPSAFVILESLPLTPSGKLERRALPAPDSSDRIQVQFDPPQGSIEETLASTWQELLSIERVGRDDNFFEIGGHSLLVLKVLFKINHALGCALKVTDLYKSPTIRELAAHIGGQTVTDEYVDLSREAALGTDIVMKAAAASVGAKGILLTGATGFVGRFLLAELLETSDATIYCMVRAQSNQDALIRLRAKLAKWDLWREGIEGRVVAVRGDLRQPKLGLDGSTYHMLAQGVDTIYHCATSMNHLETYAMAKPANVEASKEMLRLATQGRAKVVNYVSTLGVFTASANGMPRTVDESCLIDHERHLSSRGYAASKWVGEKIFMTANERGIPCNIFRIGLVWSDTRLGRYDELQRGYRIFKSCLLSGYGIRNYKFDMAPMPVDYVARAIVFLANQHGQGGGLFHVASGAEMHDGIFERCNEIAGTELELMSFYDWIGEMKRLHRDGMSMPVVPLIEFAFSMSEASFEEHQRRMRTNNRFDCTRTQQALKRGGVVIPEFDDELVGLTVRSMLVRDPELRDIVIGKSSPNWRGMASSARGLFK